jgi:hypothetical protein
MWILLTTTLLLAASPEVTVTTLAGERVSGALAKFDTDGATIETASGSRTWSAADLLSLSVKGTAAFAENTSSAWLELIDGSQLLATDFVVAKGIARVTLVGGESLDIPTRSLRAVRLKEQESEVAKASQLARQWQDIVSTQPTGDTIVVRKLAAAREGMAEPATAALDQLEGVLADVTDEKVFFTFDEQTIPVDRAKVEGIAYFHPTGRELPEPLCRLDDVAGNRWNVKSLALADGALQVATTAGVKVELPLNRIKSLDYSAGKIVYLSDLDPETSEWTNAFGTSAATPNLTRLFSPRRDRSFGGEPLVLYGQSYAKGLAVHSRTLLEYRLQGKYTKFVALAGIDDRVRPAGDLTLVVSLDGKVLGEHRIRGKDAAPLTLEYDVRGGRKLSLLIDFGAGLDVADRLHLVNARVTK